MNVTIRHRTDAARDHDRLVIAIHRAVYLLLEGTKIAAQHRATKLIVKCSAANRALNHDVKRGRNTIWFADIRSRGFPRLRQARQAQVRRGESGQPGLRYGTATGGALVTNFTTGTGRRTGEWRNRGRVIVGFYFSEVVRTIWVFGILAVSVREETQRLTAGQNRCIVGIRNLGARGICGMRVADHREQRHVLRHAINRPACVEHFVPTMLGIRLSEHQQFHVGRVAFELFECADEIVDLLVRQRQSQFNVGDF